MYVNPYFKDNSNQGNLHQGNPQGSLRRRTEATASQPRPLSDSPLVQPANNPLYNPTGDQHNPLH